MKAKHETQPAWLNDNIKPAAKTRDTYHNHHNWCQYKFWRNKTTSLIRKAKSDIFAKSIAENKTNSFLWKLVKTLKEQSDGGSIPTTINVDNVQSETTSDVIDKLNSYFTSISDNLKDEYGEDSIPYEFSKLNTYVDSNITQNVSFQIPYMKLPDLLSIIQSLDSNKETGLDGI